MRARQMVSERLTQAVAMPHVSKPPTMLQPLSATNRVMIIGLSSEHGFADSDVGACPLDHPGRASWVVPGVANVSIWGQRDRQLQVQVDPRRLHDNNVTLLQVLETTGNALWYRRFRSWKRRRREPVGSSTPPIKRLAFGHNLADRFSKELAQGSD